MTRQHQLGKKGEQLARLFLEQNGYIILEENWRYKRAEVDLIVSYREQLIFVEVKARSYTHFGQPEDFVDAQKQKLLKHKRTKSLQHLKSKQFQVIL